MAAVASKIASLPPLVPAQIHVWTLSLDAESGMVEDGFALLSGAERLRAERFATAVLRGRFIVARASLRRLLGAYLQVLPGRVPIEYGSHGKPRLAGETAVCFSLSHAGNMAMVAVARHREVGVDIEATSAGLDFGALARQAFSPAECAALRGLEGDALCEAFYRTWVRKEACIKAHGHGFGYPTQSFSVSHWLDNESVLLSDGCESGAAMHMRVSALPAPCGFRAAVAASGQDWSVFRFDMER